MSELRLYLFGAPRLERNGQSIKIDTWKALALLAYLALNEREHSRAALATMFWPEQDEARARSSLRRALWTIRQALATDDLNGDKQTVTFHSTALVVDVCQFQSLVAAPPSTTHHEPTEIAPQLQAAVKLYQADFLAGFTLPDCPTFDEWQFFSAEQLRRTLADVLQQLIDWCSTRGDYATALEYARRWLALDPLHEPAHRLLMQLYTWAGQQSAALRQYEACRRLLEQELGARPEEATSQLYATIRSNHLAPPTSPETAFAPTRTPAPTSPLSAPHNLPRLLTPLLGRALELVELDLLMFDRTERLITITGPGGMGKTRLALAVAERHLAAQRFRDGAYIVTLAAIDDAQAILPALIAVLGLASESNQASADARKQQVLDFLASKQMLLIFDNFEQVLEGRTLLIEILIAAPAVHLLVTARERLHLHNEQVYPISGLECPITIADQDAPALALFLRTAQRTQPRFEPDEQERMALVRICQLVRGMPLALELAAGWVHLLPPSAIAEALQTNLDLLAANVHDLPERHRSMRATFDTTWYLLAEDERRIFAQLSVFRGGFTRDAAQQVAGATLKQLSAIVEKSLIEHQRATDRYEIHELLRQYAQEQMLKSGEAANVQQRHAHYFLTLVENANRELHGPQQKMWLDRIDRELDNLRAALATALQQEPRTALALAAVLGPFWRRRFSSEGWQWLQAVLIAAPEPSPMRAKALMFAGSLARLHGDGVQARIWLEESVHFWRAQPDPDYLGQALRHLGWAYYSLDPSQSIVYFEESLALFRQLGHQQRVAQCLTDLAHLTHHVKASYAQAAAYAHESLGFMRKLGDQLGSANALMVLAELIELQGNYAESARLFNEAIDHFRLLDNKRGIIGGLVSLAENAWHRRAYNEACAQGEQALTLLEEVSGHQMELLLTWHFLGLATLDLGYQAQARELLQKSLRLANKRSNTRMIARCLAGLGGVDVSQGYAVRAARLLSAADAQFTQLPVFLTPADKTVYRQWIESARTQLDETVFSVTWAEGREMALEQAVDYALSNLV